MNNWDKKWIKILPIIAEWSKDPRKKISAIIVNRDNRIVSLGYNGFPSGAADNIPSRYDRPQKYLYTEHAERNAVYNAAKIGVSPKDCTIYLRWFPCADCARAIIQSGITRLVCDEPDLRDERWGEHFKVALELLTECDVEIEYITKIQNQE